MDSFKNTIILIVCSLSLLYVVVHSGRTEIQPVKYVQVKGIIKNVIKNPSWVSYEIYTSEKTFNYSHYGDDLGLVIGQAVTVKVAQTDKNYLYIIDLE